MVWPAVIAAVGSLASSAMSASGAHKANRTNIRLAREQRAWEENMANTAYQRKRKDLEAAGYNPMLGVEGSGSVTPSLNAPIVQNEMREAAEHVSRGSSNVMENMLIKASIQTAQAQARKTEAEAKLVEAEIPFSAQNARLKADNLAEQGRKLAAEIGNLNLDARLKEVDYDISELNLKQQEELKDLVVEYQRLRNQLGKLEIPEKQALADLYKTMPEAKWLLLIKQLFK